ncbi:MAG: putative toxin-antitoxin system toxin component, PIN family [Bacteroidota bacterium]
MKIVLDTNVLTVVISRRSRYYPIYQSLRNGDYELLVTTDILLEYEEVIAEDLHPSVAENTLGALDVLPNIVHIHKYFLWHLITADPDDDKFVDCAVAGRADYIVTNDRHFNVLKQTPFPKVKVLKIDEFLEMVLNHAFD